MPHRLNTTNPSVHLETISRVYTTSFLPLLFVCLVDFFAAAAAVVNMRSTTNYNHNSHPIHPHEDDNRRLAAAAAVA